MNKLRKVLVITAVSIVSGAFVSGVVRAEQNFSQYSYEELLRLRTQAQNMNEADRLRLQQELQMRVRNMDDNEQARLGLETDAQKMKARERTNADDTTDNGELNRERQRIESENGYGRGFDSRPGNAGGSSHGGRGR